MNNPTKPFNYKWLLMLLAVLGLVSAFVLFNQRATARPQEDGTLVLSVQDEDAGVIYQIGVDHLQNELNGMVEYDHSSLDGLQKYREFNERELARILQNKPNTNNIPARITFSHPLDQAEFSQFVQQYNIETDFYTIYMLEADGKIATIQGSPSQTDLVPNDYFQTATSSISEEYNEGAQLVGWVEIDGTVPLAGIADLQNDRRVFLIDVMQLFLQSQLTDQALAAAGIARGERKALLQAGFSEIYWAPVAWHLYHLGLTEADSSQ